MLFGERPIDPRELVDALVQGVVPKIEKNEPWTKAVMDVLRELGKKKGHYVTPDPSVDQREYMLDLLWFADSETNDILLAVESEWGGKRNVWEDFDKLMHIKAPLKVMILSTNRHGEQSQAVVKGIQELYMQKFSQHVKGEEYLLIEFVHPHKRVHCHHYEVPKDGKIENVRFEPLSPIPYLAT